MFQIKKLNEKATIPVHATAGSAGYDLCACFDNGMNELNIPAGVTVLIPTGLSMAIPEGWVGLVFPRSGLATKRNLGLANSVAVIDSDYRGELRIPLKNKGNEPQSITDGDRIAQLVLVPYFMENPVEVDELDETERGAGGFGSTGVR